MEALQKRVLILDDEPVVGQSMAMVAEHLGAESMCVMSPDLFFAAVDEWNPTHVVIDLFMPDMAGATVIEQLAHRSCRARITISSGAGGRDLHEVRELAIKLGLNMAAVLPKPVRLAALREFLSEHQEAVA